MDKIYDYLVSIEDYLRSGLADENLSTTAQIKRRHLLDKFYALDLPPVVARKSAAGDANCTSTVAAGLASVNGLKRQSSSGTSAVQTSQQNGHQCRAPSVKDEVAVTNDSSDGLYEDPDLMDGRCTASSDVGSDTEYESYNEEEEHLYVNNGQVTQFSDNSEEIRLPRMRPKKKKKKEFGGVSSLSNVTHSGNLYQKGMFSWTQRYCAISDRQLVCYRNDRDSKPLLCVPLHGRDVMYSSRADCRFTHALRLSRPGCETHWFFADTKDSADLWLARLCAAAGVPYLIAKADLVSCESDDLSAVKTDAESSAGDNLSSHTNLSGGSSEGGSGDGVVQAATERSKGGDATLRKQNVTDRQKKSKIGEISESLQTLIGTLSKKKGDKIKRALTDVSNVDSENTVLAGYVNVSCEATGSKWVKRFCVVKRHRFDCYKDPLDETIEFSFSLYDATIDLAHKRLKRDLALRLVHDGKEVLIEAFNETDYARWLNMLIRETSSVNGGREPADGIYDEVYNWAIYQPGDKVAMSAPPPPPLPRLPPPKAAQQASQQAPQQQQPAAQQNTVAQARDENDYIEPQMVFDNMFDDDGPLGGKDDSLGLEEAVNSAFKHLREGSNVRTTSPVRKNESKPLVRSSSASPASARRLPNERGTVPVKSTVSGSADTQNLSNQSSPSKDAAVVKGYSGPTIDEDKELLQATQNPILIELRREKSKKEMQDKTSLDSRLEQLRRSYEEMKKKRQSVNGSLQLAKPGNKLLLEEELKRIDREMEATDREITKLSFLAPQNNGGDRFRRADEFRRSVSSPRATTTTGDGIHRLPSFVSVSRNASLRETSSHMSSGRPLNYSSSSASSSPSSIRRSNIATLATEKRSSFSGVSSATSSVERDVSGTSTSAKITLAKTSSMSHVGSTVSGAGAALKPRQSSTLPPGLTGPSAAGASVDGSKKTDQIELADASTRKVVQQRLKLWESLSENRLSS